MARNKRIPLLLGLLGGSADPSASFTVTTTGAQALTIDFLGVSAATTVEWGDGSNNVYTGTSVRTHAYAGTGTYTVRIMQPLNVTNFSMETPGVLYSFNSASLGKMKNATNFRISMVGARSSVLNLVDFTAWRPTYFYAYNGFGNVTGAFNTAGLAAWSTAQILFLTNNTSLSNTIVQADVAGLIACNNANLSDNGWTQAQVDAALLGLYTAAQSKTTTNGTLNLSGTNAAPSGTYEATCPPTTGKSAAYELINDSCGTIAAGETWTTITVTGGLP
jgi:hypothetical protein